MEEFLVGIGSSGSVCTGGAVTANVGVAGVDLEEAGEKWRAGDAAKAARFFIRATETYEAGLRRFPQSFDLAYNKYLIERDSFLSLQL